MKLREIFAKYVARRRAGGLTPVEQRQRDEAQQFLERLRDEWRHRQRYHREQDRRL